MLSETTEVLTATIVRDEPDVDLVPGIRYRLDPDHCIVETRSRRFLLPARYQRYEACSGQLRLPDDNILGGLRLDFGPGTAAHLETVGMSWRGADYVDVTAELTADGFTARHVELTVRLVELSASRAIVYARGWIAAAAGVPSRSRHSDPVSRLMTSSGDRLEIAARFIR